MRFFFQSLSFGARLTLSLLAFSGAAQAEVAPYPSCERDPTESDVSAAKGAYEAGEVSFQEADYERSLLYWEDAFRRDCTAVKLLLNIARAYELNGNLEAAVMALQTYIDRRPDAKDRTSVEKRIAKLRERVEVRATPVAPPEDAEPKDAQSDDVEPEEKEPTPAAATAEAPSKVKRRPAWPLVLTGVGVAGAIAGHTVAFIQQKRIEDRKDSIAIELGCNPDTNECVDDATRDKANEAVETDPGMADLRSRRDVGHALAGVGHLVGLTGGVIWWIAWSKHKSPEKTAATDTYFQPVVAPGYQGLSFSGRF